jgi:hypothetical protein
VGNSPRDARARVPAYQTHIDAEDLVILTPENLPQELSGVLRGGRSVLVLLNQTAQAALTHHLDEGVGYSLYPPSCLQ